MKTLLQVAIVLAIAIVLGGEAMAQRAQPVDIYGQLSTNKIAQTTTNSETAVITTKKLSGEAYVALQLTCSQASNGVTTVISKFARSFDGSTYETTPGLSWTITANATAATTNTFFTNVSARTCSSLKLVSIESTGTNGNVNIIDFDALIRPETRDPD